MTLVEYLARAPKASLPEKVQAVLHYSTVVDGVPILRVQDVRERLVAARVPKAKDLKIAQALSRSSHHVDRGSGANAGFWLLTDSGRSRVEDLFGEIEDGAPTYSTHARQLQRSIATVSDPLVRSYLEEALRCLEVGARRAAIVFVWTGAIRRLEDQVFSSHKGAEVTAALRKHDPRARAVSRVSDFANIKDVTELLAFQDLGLLDKAQRQTLDDALSLRNRCGHPTDYVPGEAKVAAFIEDLVGIVFA